MPRTPFSSTNQPANRGRKPKPKGTAIQQAEQRIRDRLPEIVDALLEAGMGVLVQETDKDGQAKVYQRPPDVKALTYLFDRVAGKPVQQVEGDVDHHHTFSADDFIAAALRGGLRARVLEEPDVPVLSGDVRELD